MIQHKVVSRQRNQRGNGRKETTSATKTPTSKKPISRPGVVPKVESPAFGLFSVRHNAWPRDRFFGGRSLSRACCFFSTVASLVSLPRYDFVLNHWHVCAFS